MSEAIQVGDLGLTAATKPRAAAGFGKLTNIQVLRAFAALSVALLHAASLLESAHGDGRMVKLFNIHLGQYGVALFFAISGFLMAQLVRSTDPRTFLLHRVLRIYPIFLICSAIAFPALYYAGQARPFDWMGLLLAPVGQRFYVLGIEWTLLHEIVFYLGLFLLASAGLVRHLETLAFAWLAALAATSLSGSEAAISTVYPRLDTILLADANVAFAAGLLIPAAIARGLLPARLCLLAIPASLAMVWGEVPAARWALGFASVLIVAGLVQIRQMEVRGPASLMLVRFGDWSYVLYLVHMPVIVLVIMLAPKAVPTIPLYVAAIAASLGVTAALGPLDVGLYRRLRVLGDSLRGRWLTCFTWSFALAYVGVAATVTVTAVRHERDAAVARSGLATLPPGSLADAATLSATIDASPGRAPTTFTGELERAYRLDNGRTLVNGWSVDLSNPTAVSHLAVVCGGKVVALARPQRFRPDIAAKLARPELRKGRIGFQASFATQDCAEGSALIPVFLDARGGLLTTPPLAMPKATAR